MKLNTQNKIKVLQALLDGDYGEDVESGCKQWIKKLKKESNIDFDKLLIYFNKITGKSSRVIPQTVKDKYLARIRDGYTKKDIANAIKNSVEDKYHKETLFKYLTLEYFSRSKTIDLYSNVPSSKKHESSTHEYDVKNMLFYGDN